MTRQQELDALRAKLAVRDGREGFKTNIAAIRARIAILEREIANGL